MKTSRKGYGLLVATALFALAPPAWATLIVTGGTGTARDRRPSTTVVVGRVIEVGARWERGRIVSDATVEVDELVLGHAPSTMTVSFDGGSLDGVRMQVIEGATLEAGERALLFLRPEAEGAGFAIAGMSRGKVRVFEDRGGSQVMWASPDGRQYPVSLAAVVSLLRDQAGVP
jgi:hypothetical protein